MFCKTGLPLSKRASHGVGPVVTSIQTVGVPDLHDEDVLWCFE